MRLIYYDTETTGLRADVDRTIEIAAYDPESQRHFVQLIHPGCPIPDEATAIHQISNAMVVSSPPFGEIARSFVEFCGDECALIAHNNDAFDRLFLEAELRRCNYPIPSWHYIDTLKWARKYRPDLPRHTLQFLREVYQVPANQAHRALDDVIVLHAVFTQMTGDLTPQQIIDLLSGIQRIERMPFGKHQGKRLRDIPPNYIEWLRQSGALDKTENRALKLAFAKLDED